VIFSSVRKLLISNVPKKCFRYIVSHKYVNLLLKTIHLSFPVCRIIFK
jgi:hypothetical protein